MGGQVTIAVRRNGLVCAHQVHTSTLHVFGSDYLFLEGKPCAVRAAWDGLTGQDALAPVEHGLVVIDADRRWVGDFQSYTCLATLNADLIELCRQRDYQSEQSLFGHTVPSELGRFQIALNAGAIGPAYAVGPGTRRRRAGNPTDWEPVPWSRFDADVSQPETLYRAFENATTQRGSLTLLGPMFTPPGWTFCRFSHGRSLAGIAAFAKTLVRNGFVFSADDGQAWARFCKDLTKGRSSGPDVMAMWQAHAAAVLAEKMARATDVQTAKKPRPRL